MGKHWIVFAAALSVLSGCAGKKIAKDQVDQVRKVAVIGFSLEQRMPNTEKSVLGALGGNQDQGPMAGATPAPIAEPAARAQVMYDALQKELVQGMSWKVLARQDLVRQASYSELFREKTKQPQFRPLVSGKNVEMFIPDGIVETFLLNSMTLDERRELIRKLGVDAVAVATVHVELENGGGLKHLIGAGDFHSKAKVDFKLYNAVSEDPIWMDLNADGDETADSVSHTLGFANVDALNQQAIATTQDAIHKLVTRYRE